MNATLLRTRNPFQEGDKVREIFGNRILTVVEAHWSNYWKAWEVTCRTEDGLLVGTFGHNLEWVDDDAKPPA